MSYTQPPAGGFDPAPTESDAVMIEYSAGAAPDPSLYNEDLAPLKLSQRRWGPFAIFNVWTNDVQSIGGYTLAAGLFIGAGINGWWVFAAIVAAGVFINWLVNLSGRPSVKYGVPYAVVARSSMGVRGAIFPATIRGIVAIFWYGCQTYFASTAVALAINALADNPQSGTFLHMNAVDWISFIIVAVLQTLLFWKGLGWIEKFLNFAGPAVYVVMVALLIVIWVKAGDKMLDGVANIFNQNDKHGADYFTAIMIVFGTMVSYFAAVVINFGDFARFTRSTKAMKRGNFLGLPVSLTFFTFLALFTTAGAYVLGYATDTGDPIENPTQLINAVDNTALSVIAAFAFLFATVGINLVANFIPPAYDLANLWPSKINFKIGGMITAVIGFVIGGLWIGVIDTIGGFAKFVNTLGAILSPLYGILIADYYVVKKRSLVVEDLFSMERSRQYYFTGGWNLNGVVAVAIAGVFSVCTVWVPALGNLHGYEWFIGAAGGALLYIVLSIINPKKNAPIGA
ncbi:MAG: NCS1 family nucleobase:cation symporter-1 [Bifidobacteriaceae bacterium]|jgi:NCS1 family nucleobase:cation symporter-1|nr:NCS1 family nucleobase:cation symporter-1 [Bifidobacteriaceae bacterium]